MKIYQSTSVDNPNAPDEIANKDYVDGKLGDASSSFAAPVFITDITPGGSGLVGNKQYLDNTVPTDTVITEATSDDDSVSITILAEGGRFYSPSLTVYGIPDLPSDHEIILTQDEHDVRTFHGQVTITGITERTELVVESNTGASTSVIVNVAEAGPTIQSSSIDEYPNNQTSMREGQEIGVFGVTDNSTVRIAAVGGAAVPIGVISAEYGDENSAGPGLMTFTATIEINDKTGSLPIEFIAYNEFGTPGDLSSTTNTIDLDQLTPTISDVEVVYPFIQSAIKQNEEATINYRLTNTTQSLLVTQGVLDVVSGNDSLSESVVVSTSSDIDVDNGTNFTITADKPSNGSSVEFIGLVTIVNQPHTNRIEYDNGKMISSPDGLDYIIRLVASRPLSTTVRPSISAPSGTIKSMSRLSNDTWSITISVKDSDDRGVFNYNNIVTTGESGIDVSGADNTQYEVGGFTTRTLTVPLFDDTPNNEIVGRTVDLGVTVYDPSKLTVSIADVPLTFIDNVNDAPQAFTVVDTHQGFEDPYVQRAQYTPDGSILYINDRDVAGSNTTGTLNITVSEVA